MTNRFFSFSSPSSGGAARLLLCCAVILIPRAVQAANEVRAFCAGISTAYYVIRGTDGTIWYPTGQVFETFGTAGRIMSDYDVALVNKSGGYFVGSFDTNVSAGYYYWAAHYQTTGTPIDADPPVWAEWGYWNATTWTPSVKSPWDELMADHTGETTFGGEVQQLDPNITLILADTSELQTDWTNGGRLDLLVDAIKAITDLLPVRITTVSAATDANSFTVTAGKASTDAYTGHWIMVEDASDSNRELRCITYWSSARVVEVDAPFSFTPVVADKVWIWTGYLGDLIGMAERNDTVQNVFDLSGSGGVQRQGMTLYDASGEDP